MGDELDGCECVWVHELAMRRLLSMMRQGQSYCTDTECIDTPGRLPAALLPTGNEDTSFTIMTMFMMLAVVLYFIRPDSFIKFTNEKKSTDQRPHGQDPDGGAPPPSPSAAN